MMIRLGQSLLLFGFLTVAPSYTIQEEDIPHNEVKNWALKFGVNLWAFGHHITNMGEMQKRYKSTEVTVRKKDGVLLTRDIAAEIKNLMDMKRNSIMRIMDSAEQAALSQLSEDKKKIRVGKCQQLREIGIREEPTDECEMAFQKNRHFENYHVNTTFSCLLFPSAVSPEDSTVQNDIKWMQDLDTIFKSNYEIDPFLAWQYFGTPRGALLRHPAVKWSSDGIPLPNIDEYRLSLWFVEAMTSSKDIVILLDTSTSLSESHRHLARVTAKTILDTLGDNDFVNIFSLDSTEQAIVPCFRDLLVQGTEKNKRKLIEAIKTVKSANDANITGAFSAAFEILHRYNRTGKGSQCNQAIMLVTNQVPSDYNEIFKEYNWPHKPVRVFTYLIGNGKSKEDDMKTIACNNKGYYEHIKAVDEVREKVLNYVLVMARPLVMYENDHPVHWTSVYPSSRNYYLSDSNERPLVVTVSAAAFDRRNHAERTANVLGVAAADIPVQEIKKLVPPNKLGVNGYSYLINNNGHVIYHPEFQSLPYKNDYSVTLRQDYVDVDLSDVEFLDTSSDTDNNTLLLELRRDMIDQKEGELDIRLKLHFDSVKRITFRSYKYFFHPIYDTPFSLGIALPNDYGMYEILAEEEVKRSPVNVTDFFQGSNWKVHPDWVYCEYHYPAYRDFYSPEEQVLHFLKRATQPGWKWMSMRPRPLDQNLYLGEDLPTRNSDSYFCDKNLLQSLIFDAKLTQEFEKNIISIETSKQQQKHQGYEQFGETMIFIATRSGLMRWHDFVPAAEQSKPHFSQMNRRSIDEVWYKRAVDHYEIEQDSFVYSIPFNAGGGNANPQIIATHAIFIESQGYKAPVAVVGIQFQYRTLAAHFLNITSTCTGAPDCRKKCSSEDLDCYILDDNGFIIISERPEHAGQFFGETDGTIMDSLVQDGIYKKVFVYDHQATCEDNQSPILDSASSIFPFKSILSLMNWFIMQLFWFISKLSPYHLLFPEVIYSEQLEDENPSYSDDDYGAKEEDTINFVDPNNVDFSREELEKDNNAPFFEDTTTTTTTTTSAPENEIPTPPPLYVPSPHKIRRQQNNFNSKVKRCTKKVPLYILQPARLNNSGLSNPLKGKLTNCHATGCERPFSVQKIPHSNLMLLVVDTLCPCGSKQLSITPQEVLNERECDFKYDNLYRRRLSKCINYHPEETEIQQCGKAYRIILSSYILFLPFTVFFFNV
ncbi:voltage-dependent calcium channel subunit alpha-2/delta-3 isoform X2 [Planococcus citri]|uniref:voltage-dependent calcium channel subunit alpha-2/delta-3 isoform X2 n=1 Tax=Planococcus citri TaxID=170843 RepID=UPI0031F9053C